MTIARTFRALFAVFGLVALFGCDAHDAGEPPRPMGNFQMGLNIVVPDTAQTIALSRKATPEEWKTVMTQAMQDRFGSYTGDKLFDFGISIDGYMLAPPGVPVVASPHSALIITVNVWDDAKQELLVKGGKRITFVEGMSPESVIGSGWTQNKNQQMKKLAFNAAKAVQNYMLDHPEWLDLPPKGASGSSSATSTDVPAPDATAKPAPDTTQSPATPKPRPSGA
ncbi:MAG: hypothetical protein ACOH2H_25545 [Cypionkella sp.]